MNFRIVSSAILAGHISLGAAWAQDETPSETEDLAQALSNPVSSLISLPFQLNYDSGYGSEDGSRTVMNLQPVIPMQIGEDWNMVSRTIIPFISQNDIAGNSGTQSGLGDVVQSLFFTPREVGSNGLIWGAGPVFMLPTASDDKLGSGKFGLGPTAVVLRQKNGWTVGMLTNHIWSVAGDDDRADVSATFLQPFLNYTTKNSWTFALNTESTYDWKADEWSVPINMMAGKLVYFDEQPVNFQLGARYWADAPENGPEDWGVRAVVTFLYPKK